MPGTGALTPPASGAASIPPPPRGRRLDTRHRGRAQVMDDVRERAAPRDPETRAARKQPFDELGCDRAEDVVGAVRSVGGDDGARESVVRCGLEPQVDVLATRRAGLHVNDAFAARTLEVPGHGRRIEAECLGDLGLTLAAQIEPGRDIRQKLDGTSVVAKGNQLSLPHATPRSRGPLRLP